jgi:putative pyrroloquinoline-quinone-binding quinoprotein
MTQNAQAGKVIYPANVPGLKKAWTYMTEDGIESSPVVEGRMLYIGSKDHTLFLMPRPARFSGPIRRAAPSSLRPRSLTMSSMLAHWTQRSTRLKPAQAA